MYFRLHSQSLHLQYSNHMWSVAFWLNVFLLAVSVLLTYLVVYQTGHMWKQVDWSRHSVRVLFKDELLTQIGTRTGSQASPSKSHIWSTFPELNKRFNPDQMRIPTYQVQQNVLNCQHTSRFIEIRLFFPLTPNETVVCFEMLTAISVQLNNIKNVSLESILWINQHNPGTLNALEWIGTLQIQQTVPLPVDNDRIPANGFLMQNLNEATNLFDIMADYENKDFKGRFFNSITRWTQEPETNQFVVTIRVHTPVQWIQMTSRFWTQIKFAWIQYLSIFLVIHWAFGRLKNELFQHDLVSSDVRPCEALQTALLYTTGKLT